MAFNQKIVKLPAKKKPGAPPSPAKKKPTSTTVDLDKIDPKKLKPGQKQELAIQLSQSVNNKRNIENQIEDLKHNLATSKKMQTWDTTAKVEGLLANLKKLHTEVQKQIKELKNQLKQPPVISDHEQKLIDLINNNCSEYIQAVKTSKSWLYRGAGGPEQYLARSWEARKPKDSDPQAQKVFDQMLKQLGFTALRGNSIFTTSVADHAAQFGFQVYVILPLDKHSAYTYTKHDDITLEFVDDVAADMKKISQYKDKLTKHLQNEQLKPNLKQSQINALEDFEGFIDWEEIESIIKKVAAHVKAGNKFNIPPELANVTMEDFQSSEIFIKNFQPQKTDLAKALKNGFEVMIYGVYLALETGTYGPLLQSVYNVRVEDMS